MKDQIAQVIEEQVRPLLQRDGGDCAFVEYVEDRGEVQLQLQGACHGCPAASYTLKLGVEQLLKREFPDHVQSVVEVR